MHKQNISILIMLLLSSLIIIPARAEQGKPLLTLKQAMELDKHGKFKEAVDAIKQIIEQKPEQDKSKAYMSLGLVYFRSGDYENALAGGFLKTVELKKENAMAYYFIGMIYEKKALSTSKQDTAKEMKSKALEAWQNYLKYAPTGKNSSGQNYTGVSPQESIKRAKNHVEILQEGLQ